MGGFLSLFGGGSSSETAEIIFDIEELAPGSPHTEVFEQAKAFIRGGDPVLQTVFEYGDGCKARIGEAIAAPQDTQIELAAWSILVEKTKEMVKWQDYSKELSSVMPALLKALGTMGSYQEGAPMALQMAHIFSFILQFDEAKMTTAQISNDLAFYRRIYPNCADESDATLLKCEDTMEMSMFLAKPSPMMMTMMGIKALSDEKVQAVLIAVANSTRIASKHETDQARQLLLLRAMVGATVLYDNVSEQGVFHKKSPIPVMKVVKTLESAVMPTPPGSAKVYAYNAGLISQLRYSTRHLKDPSTPSGVADAIARAQDKLTARG